MIPKPIAYMAQESTSPSQARRAINAGFKSIAMQLGKATSEAVKVARDAGLFVAVWGPVGGTPTLPVGTQAFIGQVESPGQFNGAVAAFSGLRGTDVQLAVVTTYWGMYDVDSPTDGSQWKTLAALGVSECHVECYKADGSPHDDINRMLGQGEVYGIPKSVLVPVVGTYAGEYPSDYAGLAERVPNYGIYIIEQTADAALEAFHKLPPAKPPASDPLPDPAVINANIVREAHTWLDPHEGDDAQSRLRSIARIASTTDTQWVNARARVIAALDSVGASQG
jgi:hypothetical protein